MAKKRIYRWIPAERIGHWAYAALFIAALISARSAGEGGEGSRSATGNPAVLHGTLGLLMIGIPLLLFLLFARKRLVENVREVTHWDADDRDWLRRAIRGGALLRREMPPQGRFNAGQKLATMLAGLVALIILITGCTLLFAGRGHLSVGAWGATIGIHAGFVVFALVVLVGHVAHVVLLKGGTKYLASMFTGWLEEETAKDHHYKWWKQASSKQNGK
jgi:formate dehydrogenase subunit gamma